VHMTQVSRLFLASKVVVRELVCVVLCLGKLGDG
jgi:hypothetical protein